MAETNDVSMAEEEEVGIIEEGENVRPKRSLSISSTDNTPSKRRRIGTKPVSIFVFCASNPTLRPKIRPMLGIRKGSAKTSKSMKY